ncbi:MAG: BREX system P-loop protein BrxC [Phycisphaerae bacterium]
MQIKDLFERDIFRPINGVVKADQLDDASVWQELDEFVITRELNGHIRKFFASYLDAMDNKHTADASGKIGVWISGFFGSGKSHFLKVLSYLLRNHEVSASGQSKKAVEFFDSKIKDAMLLADIKRAVAAHTDVILFNIDSKASHKGGRDAILQVFLKVLNEMQGYSPDHPHIAHMERHLDEKHLLAKFKDAFRAATGNDWEKERDAYEFNRDQVVQAFMQATGQSNQSATQWIDNAEAHFSLTVENFCKWVKEYLDSKGSDRRLIFLVDEIGQFIGTDSHLMLNLQTITEELGVTCKGRAWIVVTSQEDIDAVLGEMKPPKTNDFSKITGRFRTRLSLSSANVDEVIQSRLLAKSPDAKPELTTLFTQKGDIMRNQLTFGNVGMTLRGYKDAEDFIKNYPLVPYQFTLLQKIFESIRKSGATGLHLARGERSILDAVQSALKTVALQGIGILVPLYHFYPAIENFLDTSVKQTIDQAKDRRVEDFDIELLKVLFLIRYVDEMKGNVDNLVTLCVDGVDTDRVALRRKIEESLARLEKETLIARSGENYFFLTNQERDINREIKNVELSGGEEAELLGNIIFDEVLKEQRKHRYSANKMDFDFNRRCDGHPVGNELQGSLLVSVITPLSDECELYQEDARCKLASVVDGGILLVRLGANNMLIDELRIYKKTEKYLARKNDGTQPEQTRRILSDIAAFNRERRTRLTGLLDQMLIEASYFANGVPLPIRASTAKTALEEAMEYLVKNTFTKMQLLARLFPDDQSLLREIAATLRNNNISPLQPGLQGEPANAQALQDIRSYVDLCGKTSRQIVLYDMIQNRYAKRPYGWPEMETALLVVQLLT